MSKSHRRFSNGDDSIDVQEGREQKKEKKYGATILMSVRDALAANRRLAIRELVERVVMGNGNILRKLAEHLQMLKIILSYKFYLYLIHVANTYI